MATGNTPIDANTPLRPPAPQPQTPQGKPDYSNPHPTDPNTGKAMTYDISTGKYVDTPYTSISTVGNSNTGSFTSTGSYNGVSNPAVPTSGYNVNGQPLNVNIAPSLPSEQPLLVNQVNAALKAGYDPNAIINAVIRGQNLLPSDNQNVRNFVNDAERQYNGNAGFEVTPTQMKAVSPLVSYSQINTQFGFQSGNMTGGNVTRPIQTVISAQNNTSKNEFGLPNVLSGKTSGLVTDITSSVPLGQVSLSQNQTTQIPVYAETLTPKGYLEEQSSKINQIIQESALSFNRNPSKGNDELVGLTSFGAGILETGIGFAQAIRHPITTAENILTAITHPVDEIIKPLANIPNEILTGTPAESGFLTGKVVANVAAPKVLDIIKNTGVDLFVKSSSLVGAERVPLESVESPDVTAGSKFPTSYGTQQALAEFQKTNKLVTASPQGIKGTEIGVGGGRTLAGLQDPGLYATPEGRVSTYFLGLDPNAEGYSFTLNPLKNLLPKVPTIGTFEVKGVTTYPREIAEQPGFAAVTEYQKEVLAPQGMAVLTKRSEIGQGTIQPKSFIDLEGKPVAPTVKAQGTNELEAVIPVTSQFVKQEPQTLAGQIFGFEKYTVKNGRAVAMPEFKVISVAEEETVSQAELTRSREQFNKGSQAYSELSSGKTYISPTPAIFTSLQSSTPSKIATVSLIQSNQSSLNSSLNLPSSKILSSNKLNDLSSTSSSNKSSNVSNSSQIYNSNSSYNSSQKSQTSSNNSSNQSSIMSSTASSSPNISYSPDYSSGRAFYGSSLYRSSSKASSTGSSTSSFKLPPPSVPVSLLPTSKSYEGPEIAFDVEVRGKGHKENGKFKPGRFFKANKAPQTLQAAEGLLSEKLLNSAKMTGYLVPVRAKAGAAESKAQFDSSKFDVNKKGYFVQKRKTAISSAGEKEEIRRKPQFGFKTKQRSSSNSFAFELK